jgi:radical SAM modification target selenobiotic family peptide
MYNVQQKLTDESSSDIFFKYRKAKRLNFSILLSRFSSSDRVSSPHFAFSISYPRGKMALTLNLKGGIMDLSDLKKILAGFCIAGLISGSTLILSSCDSAHSA